MGVDCDLLIRGWRVDVPSRNIATIDFYFGTQANKAMLVNFCGQRVAAFFTFNESKSARVLFWGYC